MGLVQKECEPPAVAQFLVAALEGAILLTKVTKDIGIMERCVQELKQHLTLYTTGGIESDTRRANGWRAGEPYEPPDGSTDAGTVAGECAHVSQG